MINVFKHVIKKMWNFINEYGATICSNGWDNVARYPLLNLMLFCPNGDIFLGAIDTIEV
jgi:hypothetical protein